MDSPESRRLVAEKTRLVLVLLCLHVVVFQILAGVLISVDVGTSIGSFFLLFAVLYLGLSIALGLDLRYSRALGFALCAATVAFWILALVAYQTLVGSLPRSGWFIDLSILEVGGILIGLVILRQTGRSLPTSGAS
ncbi:MAG TPA: hypothetical protein VNP71_01280 [Thermoplasmata archaeon]|nr:hypothetical protein [Thermoplasmata archaeon]